MTDKNDSGITKSETLDLVSSEKEASGTTRRSVVKGVVASAVATVGFTGAATALDPTVELRSMKRQFDSQAAARGGVKAHGRELLGLLVREGFLDNASVDELGSFDVTARDIDTPTARIQTEKQLDDGHLTVAVEPHAGRQYALFTPNGNEKTTILDPDADDDVSTQCFMGNACMAYDYQDCRYMEVCCGSSSCYTGSVTGNCSGSCHQTCEDACNL